MMYIPEEDNLWIAKSIQKANTANTFVLMDIRGCRLKISPQITGASTISSITDCYFRVRSEPQRSL